MAILDMSLLDNLIERRSYRVRGGGRGRGLRVARGSIGPLALRGVRGAMHLDGHRCRGPLGLRAEKGPGGTFGGPRRSHGHPCRGPLGLRGVRGPGGPYRGARKLDGHHFRGSLGRRGVPEGTFKDARLLDGHHFRGSVGLRGVRGPEGTFKGARRLDGHHFRESLGLGGVRGPEGTFKGARRLDGHHFRGSLGLRGVRGPEGTFKGARPQGPLGLRAVRGGTSRGAGRLDGTPRRGPLGMYTIIKSVQGTRDLPGQNSVSEHRFKVVGSSGEASGTKLLVSNLNAGVSNEDIRALFSEIGELIRYGIHYDKDGSPCGSAEVVFAQSSDAFQAVKRNNNADLNGKPMKIEKVGSKVRPHVASRSNMIGGSYGRTRVIASSQRGHRGMSDGVPMHGRGRRGRRGGLGRRPVEKSAEELDEELQNHQAGSSQT